MNFFKLTRKQLLIVFIAMTSWMGMASAEPGKAVFQNIPISGTVTSDTDDYGLPGVSISVKGASMGTVTDANGAYAITVPADATLVFSYIGFKTVEIAVEGRKTIDVVLREDVTLIDEVVVTALGISREKKSLGYSVAEVSGEAIQKVAQENVLNSLSGKVPGVQINQTSIAGSSVSMVIRGASSLTSDNQPLFVVDGVPMKNSMNNINNLGGGSLVDYGNAISDLNTEDIESISILKGPSAAALYGARAGNGVVLITTKSGKKSKGFGVTMSSNTVFEKPYAYLKKQHMFANGEHPYTQENRPTNGLPYIVVDPTSAGWVGVELDKGMMGYVWPYFDANGQLTPTELISYPDNYKNFFECGLTSTNNVSVENSTEKLDYRVSYTNMQNKGVIPNSDLHRHSFALNSSLKITDKISLSSNMNYTTSSAKNRPSSGGNSGNPLMAIYELSPTIDVLSLKNVWQQEHVKQNSPYRLVNNNGVWEPHASAWINNPYFVANEINNGFRRERIFGNVKADWQIYTDLTLMLRYSHDQYNEKRETKIPKSFTGDRNGYYGMEDIFTREQNADFLLSWNKRVSDFSLSASAGGNIMKQYATTHTTKFRNGGTGLVIPGLYTLNNTVASNIEYSSRLTRKKVNSIYGMASFGYKDFAYLDVTARNDWSSALWKGYNSYFYPSASLSVLVNNVVNMSKDISLLKLRYGWAKVGNDTEPYNLMASMPSGNWGDMLTTGLPGTMYNRYLKPEINTSWEAGVDLALFQNRLRFEGTYYHAKNTNQIFQVDIPPSNGYSSQFINAGLISSRGIELSLGGTPIQTRDWTWDVNLVLSRNRVKVEELAPGMKYLDLWGGSSAQCYARTWIGQETGQIVDRTMVRVEDQSSPYYNWPILDEEGFYLDVDYRSDEKKASVIGNFNPDFTMGMQTSISYKRFTLSASFDWRKGGQFISQSFRYNGSDFHFQSQFDRTVKINNLSEEQRADYIRANADKYLLPGGEFYTIVGGPTTAMGGLPYEISGKTLNDGVYCVGVVEEFDDEGNFVGYRENIGGKGTLILPFIQPGGWEFGRYALFDADFIKVRDLSITYQLPSQWFASTGIRNASISLYTRNLILWTKAGINIDPEGAFQPESSKQGASGIMFRQGIERDNIAPWTIPMGFKLNVSF